MGRLGWGEILVVAVLVILLFGAKNLPKIFKACGEGIREFKKAIKDGTDGDSGGSGAGSGI